MESFTQRVEEDDVTPAFLPQESDASTAVIGQDANAPLTKDSVTPVTTDSGTSACLLLDGDIPSVTQAADAVIVTKDTDTPVNQNSDTLAFALNPTQHSPAPQRPPAEAPVTPGVPPSGLHAGHDAPPRAAGALDGFEEENRNTAQLLDRAKVMLSHAAPLADSTEVRPRVTTFEPPEFVRRLNVFEEAELGSSVTFECQYRGWPRPVCKWYLDDSEIPLSDDDPQARVVEDRSGEERDGTLRLVIRDAKKTDEGAYKCKAESQEGMASTTGYLSITGLSIPSPSPAPSSPRPSSDHAVSTPPLLGAISEQQSMEEREAAAYESEITPLQQFIENVERGATSWPYAELDFLRTEEQRLAAAATAAAAAADVTTFPPGGLHVDSKDFESQDEGQETQSLDGWGSNMSVDTVRERPATKSSLDDLSADWVAVQHSNAEPSGFNALPLDGNQFDKAPTTPTPALDPGFVSCAPLSADFVPASERGLISFGASDDLMIDQQGGNSQPDDVKAEVLNSNLDDDAKMKVFSLMDYASTPIAVPLESRDVMTLDAPEQKPTPSRAKLTDENVAKNVIPPFSNAAENICQVPEPSLALSDVKPEDSKFSNDSPIIALEPALPQGSYMESQKISSEILVNKSTAEEAAKKSDFDAVEPVAMLTVVPALNEVVGLNQTSEKRDTVEDRHLLSDTTNDSSSSANISFIDTTKQGKDEVKKSHMGAVQEEIKLAEDITPSPSKSPQVPGFTRMTSIGSLTKDVHSSAFLGVSAAERSSTKPSSKADIETAEIALPPHLESILGKTRVDLDIFKTLDWLVEWTSFPWSFYLVLVLLMTVLGSALELSPTLVILVVALVSSASFWFLIPEENASEAAEK